MYDNIGRKIKGLAKVMFIIEAFAAVISGLAIIADDEDMIILGLLIIVMGPLVAWVSSWLLYGFGQLIENSEIIKSHNHVTAENTYIIAENTNEIVENIPTNE